MEFISYKGIAGSIQDDIEILMLHSTASTNNIESLDLYRFLQDISLVIALDLKRRKGLDVKNTLKEIYVQNHRFYVTFFQESKIISIEEAEELLNIFVVPKV